LLRELENNRQDVGRHHRIQAHSSRCATERRIVDSKQTLLGTNAETIRTMARQAGPIT
jgi:hypothetical protein